MSDALLLAGKLAFAAIGIAVGCRLAATARREGAMGLHSVALAAIGLGGLGLLAMPVAKPLDSLPLVILGEVAVRVAMLLLCAFIAATFRPDPLGWSAATACGLLMLATMGWDLLGQPDLLDYDYTRWSSHLNQASVALPFAWSAGESGALWLRARRRVALGLTDPDVALRYGLWTVTTACFVAICALAIVGGFATDADADDVAATAQGSRGLFYFAICLCVWRGIFKGPAESTATSTAGGA